MECTALLYLTAWSSPCSDTEAVRMLESVQDLLYQKEKAETVSFDGKKGDEAIFKKPKLPKKLSKKDISAPCNFKHVSGELQFSVI